MGDPHNGFPPGKLVPACHNSRIHHGRFWASSLLQQSHEEPKSLSFLFAILRYWLLLSGLALHGCKMAVSCSESLCLHKCMPRQEGQAFPAGLFLLGWKPFPEVPQPIHWPGLSQKPDTNCRRGWKRGLNGIFSSFSGNRSQPSQRKSSRGMGKEGMSVCQLLWQRSLPLFMLKFYLEMSCRLECNSSTNCKLSVSLIAFGRLI